MNQHALQLTSASMKVPGSRFFRCDLSKKEEVDAAALAVVKEFGHP